MAGNIELTTQGITSPFQVESTPPPEAKAPENKKNDVAEESRKASEKSLPSGMAKEAVSDVADALNSVSKAVDRNLQFSVDEETGRIVIKVTDGDTGEVIRVIPPEEISKTRDTFGSLVGLLFNEAS